MNPLADLERLVAAIEHQGANIAPTYQEYMPIAFATANDCGEAGRTFFHRICRLSEKYVYEEADKLYDHALKAGNGRNGLGSVFHWAEIAGVKTDKQLADTFRQYPRENKLASSKEAAKEPVPSFPSNPSNLQGALTPTHAHTYARENLPPAFPNYPWPPFIKQMIDCGNSIAQRDILLLGVFTVLGATLNKRVRVSYGQKYMYPCLQTFIVAPPASGKGALTWVRRLAEPIHEEMMGHYKERMKNYKEEKNRWDSLGKKRSETPEPEQPPLKMFLITGDNSGTGILENLIEADGVGLICETEADTVSTAIGADHGHWSDTLRKCHDHERLAFNRRTNHEYRECDESYLSVLLSGTPAQVKPLIPSAENGLFSRQLFYFMPPIDEWMDQFDSDNEDYGVRFATWGTQWKQVLDMINSSVQTIQLKLSDKQKELFNQRFAQLFSHAGYAYGGSMRSAVARIAINTCRILSIVALLRALGELLSPQQKFFNSQFPIFNSPGLSPAPEIPAENVKDGIIPKLDLRVTDEDFQAVLTLIEPLYRHSSYVLGFLPPIEAQLLQTTPEQALFNALPMTFSRRQAVEEAAKNGIPEKTIDSSLKRMLEKGTLVKIARGEYAFSSRVCVREKVPKE